jgi:hypothetical protein
MKCQHFLGEGAVVAQQFSEHVMRDDALRFVVDDALNAADLTDRLQCLAAELANALGDFFGLPLRCNEPANSFTIV